MQLAKKAMVLELKIMDHEISGCGGHSVAVIDGSENIMNLLRCEISDRYNDVPDSTT